MSLVSDTKTKQWIKNYKVPKTMEAIQTSLSAWNRYLKDNNIDEYALIQHIKESNEDQRYHELNNFVQSLELMPASIRQYLNFIRAYLRYIHGIRTTYEDARQLIKLPKIIKVNREPLTKEIIKDLVKNSDDIRKAWYLVLASSGMRASESLNLEYSDFDFDSNPVTISISGKITKTQTDRITFITKEAVRFIDKAGTGFFEKRDLLTEEKYFSRLRKKLGYIDRYSGSRNYKVNIHSFRAFFRTQAGKLNQDFAEAVLGHGGYLKQYVRLTKEDLMPNYLKLEKQLTIF